MKLFDQIHADRQREKEQVEIAQRKAMQAAQKAELEQKKQANLKHEQILTYVFTLRKNGIHIPQYLHELNKKLGYDGYVRIVIKSERINLYRSLTEKQYDQLLDAFSTNRMQKISKLLNLTKKGQERWKKKETEKLVLLSQIQIETFVGRTWDVAADWTASWSQNMLRVNITDKGITVQYGSETQMLVQYTAREWEAVLLAFYRRYKDEWRDRH